MRMKKHLRKMAVAIVAALIMAMFAGCGSQTAEFEAPNGEFSIQADASWSAEDIGDDGILVLYSKDSTKGIVIYQYLKSGYVFDDLADFQESVEWAYPVHDSKSADVPASVPGLANISAVQ